MIERKGAGGRNRTVDTRIFSPLLYRLSYPGRGKKAVFYQNPPRPQERWSCSRFQVPGFKFRPQGSQLAALLVGWMDDCYCDAFWKGW